MTKDNQENVQSDLLATTTSLAREATAEVAIISGQSVM
jgi:hypothetical protein